MISDQDQQTLVVVGNGMMGFRLCRRLVDCGATPGALRLVVFGEEPRPAYDRVRLTELLDGTSEDDLCFAPAEWYREHGIELRLGDPVVRIDRAECVVEVASGAVVPFDRLLLATGSRPFVPPIPGADLPDVLVYRTVEDLCAVRVRAQAGTQVVILGGGPIGMEAAGALAELGTNVVVVEPSRQVLPQQLDEAGAGLLREKIEARGIGIRAGARARRIEAAAPGLVVCLEDGGRLPADLVILAAGIRPRGELARQCGLETAGRGGVVVDDHLQSSDPRIFAVGECATHRGVTYGLAAPGYRMVDVLVDNLVGGTATFEGADRSTVLDLPGAPVAALGRYEEAADTQSHTYLAGGVYRKLVLRDGHIVGALSVGEWPDLARVRDALASPKGFSFWDLRRFRSTGSLWQKSESPPVYEWSAEALVCGCLGVRRGALRDAEAEGCETVAELSSRTGAGTACGACRPLLEELVRRTRVDSLAPARLSALDLSHDDDPPPTPTLRCRALAVRGKALEPGSGAGPRALALPPAPSPLEAQTLPSFRPGDLPSPRPSRVPMVTLLSGMAAPPSERSPLSSLPPDLPVPSSRRDSLLPLRPVSVIPGHLSGLLPAPISLAPPSAARSRSALRRAAVTALAIAAGLALVPPVPPAPSIRGLYPDTILRAATTQRATGYGVVVLALASMVLSLRKRSPRFTYGTVNGLRTLHAALGAAAVACLTCHTALRLGERLNRLLALDFLAAALLGGAAAALEGPSAPAPVRAVAARAHVLVLLPLPVLVVLHVLAAHYF